MGQIVSQDELILQRRGWKDNGQCVVVASGCFDLLHPGHIRLLEQARSHGDVLVVAVQSDASVRKSNKPFHGSIGVAEPHDRTMPKDGRRPRPIIPAPERAEILAALAAVDYVVVFDESSPGAFLVRLAPDIVIKGEIGGSFEAAGRSSEAAVIAGAKLVRIPLEPGYSTTRIIEQITQL